MPHSIWSNSLGSFSDSVAATRPAPAGVAAAAVAAELGLSLLIKTLAITDGGGSAHKDLLSAARREAAHLRGAADDDIGAVMAFMQARDAAALRQAIEAPLRAARATVAGLELCAKASVKPALAADLGAAQALLAGALRAILICLDANLLGHEEDHRDAATERRAIEDRARVYSR